MFEVKMKNIFGKKERKGTAAVTQIIILVLSTIAFAYIIGESFPAVEAVPTSGQCVAIPASGQFSESYWQIQGDNVQCIQDHCSPQSDAGRTLSISSFCTSWLGPTLRAQFCQQQGSSWTIKNSVACASLATQSAASRSSSPDLVGSSVSSVIAQTAANKAGSLLGGGAGKAAAAAKPALGTAAAGATKITVAGVVGNAALAAGIYAVTKFGLRQAGASPEAANAGGLAAGGGYVAYYVATLLKASLALSIIIGVGAGVIIFLLTFKNTRYDDYKFTCYPWDAPTGGANCQKCNTGNFPCTEYQCRSLGQGCALVNKGTGEELCVWNNSRDVTPPVIQPWIDVLTNGYRYIPDNAISPPDRGVKIVPQNNNSGCIEAFTPITFGITLDEPAKCQLDISNQASFGDATAFYFNGSSTSKMNHSQTIDIASPASLAAENITLQNGGLFTLYAKCQDANGNSNTGNFVFKFCVNQGPDTTPPSIVTTSIVNGNPIAFNTTAVNLSVYVNEPATCKWSQTDQSYNSMENNMSCSTSSMQVNAQGLYPCSTTLTGLKNSVNNDFYFRCKDQPWLAGTANDSQRNVNSQSYKFTLKGTQPLVITSVGPTGTIKDSTNVIKVTINATTSAGYNEGAAICSFSDTGNNGSYIQFFNTGTYKHSQDLFLSPGNYTYYISCNDLGGNTDTNTTSFTVESDTSPPIVVRAYHDGNYLKIITDEKSRCVYGTSSSTGCNYLYGDGISMQSVEDTVNQVAWNPDKVFYIKCADSFGNQPLPNECSIIASPFTVR